jgi:UDP-N-acetylglucosamine:LPS N-acetylglucosamine transferase
MRAQDLGGGCCEQVETFSQTSRGETPLQGDPARVMVDAGSHGACLIGQLVRRTVAAWMVVTPPVTADSA